MVGQPIVACLTPLWSRLVTAGVLLLSCRLFLVPSLCQIAQGE